MYIKIISLRKKIFFFLKKKFHKNIYYEKNKFVFLKRIFFKKIKFKKKKCIKKKNFFKNNFLLYFFINSFIFVFKNNIKKIKIKFFSLKFYFFIIKNSYIFIICENVLFLNLFLLFSKCFINFNKKIEKKVFFFRFNNLLINYNFFEKNTINNIIFFFIEKKNFFKYFILFKKINYYLFFKIEINLFSSKCFSIENIVSYNFYNFINIISNVYIKKNVNKNFIFQECRNFLFKKNKVNINLNIFLFSKKIYCKHKIIFFYFLIKKYNLIKNIFFNIF